MQIGQVYLGKYKVESILGQGGMGVVAECTHLQLNERVALKMLRPDVLLDHDAVERFMREAQAAVKLKSEYVARVSDVGTLENGTPYMVMEFLEGVDLGGLIEERGQVPVAWACELVLQTAEALAEAHSIGIVHRDIKPANLFVTWRPDNTALIKVLDFGISKAPVGTEMHLTQTQSLLGTPAYMSPEQMRSARLVDARTDIWSLGSVMYELIEGRKPFEAESFSEMCVKVAVDAPQPMRNAPPELQQVILRCLAKSPEQRYASMADLGRELVPFCHDPHQASLLVERMQRMLRRTSDGVAWDVASGTGSRSVPNHVRDPKSSPMMAQAWAGSAPVGNPSLQGVPVQHAPYERSSPHSINSTLQTRSTSGSNKKWYALFALLGLAGIGVGLAFGLRSNEPEATPAPAKPAVREAVTPPPEPAKPPVVEDTKPAVVEDKVATPTVVDPPVAETGSGAGSAKKPTPAGGHKTVKVQQTTKVRGDKPVVVEPPKPEEPKETTPKAACDPFANPRGCGK